MEDIVENVKLIVMIASLILSAVMVVLYIVSRVTRKKSTKEKVENALNTAQSMLDVLGIVQNAVIKAESHLNFTGQEKFDNAFISVKNELMKSNKQIDDKTLTDLIENEVVVSSVVNSDTLHRQKAKAELKKIEIVKEE